LLLCFLAVFALSQLAPTCAPWGIVVDAPQPEERVESFQFQLLFRLGENVDPASLEVEMNDVSILDRVSGGPVSFSAVIDPGAPLRESNVLVLRANRENGEGQVVREVQFAYVPIGRASARRIEQDADLIQGPLGHSKMGDYLLANDVARFAIQDVGQRELYSVGQYGGNLIDAERVDNPGVDNFLELQPGVNIETVINAQSVVIVNDGQDGTAAILRTCGPDDLLDFVNPSSQVTDLGLPFPPLADDRDLEVEGCTTFTLEPTTNMADPQDFVRIDTEIFNNDPSVPDPLPLLIGDWLNPSGELDPVARSAPGPLGALTPRANGVGSPVTTTLGSLGFMGFDEATGVDYAYAQLASATPGSFALISGVLVILHNDNVLSALLGSAPNFSVPLGGSRTFTRYFAVGDGSGTAAELDDRINAVATGTLEGCITSGGAPLAGARLSVGARPLSTAGATDPNSTSLATVLETRPGACPNYSGKLPAGDHQIVIGRQGHPYQLGLSLPFPHTRTITAGATTVFDSDLPAAGALHVNVVDETGAPLPARISVVGFDPSPERTRPGPSLPGFGGSTLGLLYGEDDSLPFGLTAVAHADATGSADLDLEPGIGLYHVYVSRGSEYSAWRTPAPITISAGATTVVDATIVRVLDTPGFVSSEFHVHGIRSADSGVSDLHRVESYSAEGIENVVMTDHHVHTDLNPMISATGLGDFLHATVGEEITSFDYGHFNAYPLRLDPDSPHGTFRPDGTQLSGGSTDWAQAASPGRDFPSYGALNATPAEILDLARNGPLSTDASTIQINHIDSHFSPLKIDTSQVPPADGLSDAERAARRLPSRGAVPNLFQPFPALELWNGEGRGDQAQFLDDRMGVWFNLLNQGLRTTFIADTDSHRFRNQRSAGARTWTASPTDQAGQIDPADVAAAIDAGRAVGGQGIYVQTRLWSTDGTESHADLGFEGSTTMTDANGEVQLEIHVQSPSWAQWDRVEIYRNAPTFSSGSPYQFGATPDRVLVEGDCDAATAGDGDFDIDVTASVDGVAGADRLETTLLETFSGLTADTWFVVVVRGTDGLCEPMFPVYPDDLASGSNASLADLVDGNRGEAGVMALGATNALYFEP
jgi:hypothetical protein